MICTRCERSIRIARLKIDLVEKKVRLCADCCTTLIETAVALGMIEPARIIDWAENYGTLLPEQEKGAAR